MNEIWTFLTARPTDQGWLWWLVPTTLQALALILALLIAQAFLMYFDRTVWAAVQMRKGPHVVGPFGLLQSFADLFKFVFKEIVIPAGANKALFLLAPIITFALALVADSDMICAVPRRFAETYGPALGLAVVEPPLPLGRFRLNLAVPGAAPRDAGLAWLLDQVG